MKNDHYYSETPTSESRPAEARFTYRGHALCLTSDAGVFSRGELDAGTRILLAALPQAISGDILDLGCGWGPVGICAALTNPESTVTFADINSRAVALARENAGKYKISGQFIQSDGFADIDGLFDCIITNPPIRAGKDIIYKMFSDSAAHLKPDGCLYLVIRKQQGAPSAIRFLTTVFSSVEVIDKSGGYWVIRCRKE
ncbi:MAG: class I SAM-dependent methyltransferase [Clostridia bacterium]|nr:class I SAM-dependent methyltransferase [Clostridia bacterium]